MSAHPPSLIRYDLTDSPRAVVVEFISHKIADPDHANQLNQQLHMLLRPGLPVQFILDFAEVKSMTSSAFGALAAFIRDVRHHSGSVFIYNMDDYVRFGADILRLPDVANFVASRQAALDAILAQETHGREGDASV